MKTVETKRAHTKKGELFSSLERLSQEADIIGFPKGEDNIFSIVIPLSHREEIMAAMAQNEDINTAWIYFQPGNELIVRQLLRYLEPEDTFVVFTQDNYDAFLRYAAIQDWQLSRIKLIKPPEV